jgi:peptidoglycan/xylan/chitin deacetylase (PgdA/CDA1 family)
MLRREPSVAKRPSVMSMGDFGPEVGTPRILDLLAHHGVPSTFFVPGWIAERHSGAVRSVFSAGHEIAHHGYLHEAPATLSSRAEEARLLDRGSRALEKVTGERPLGYRSPAWDVSEHTLGLLSDRGFVYDSSLMGDDAPYFVHVATGRRVERRPSPRPSPGGRGAKKPATAWLVELPVHWSLDDAPYYPFAPAIGRMGPMLSPQIALDTWLWEFEKAYEHGGAFMLTMHPYISGHWSRINGLDRLVRHIKQRSGVEFMRCVDVAAGWAAKGQTGKGQAARGGKRGSSS